jgi:hypothetical protein
MMKVNKWTLGLAALGLISLPAMVQAEEKPNQLLTALSSTTISGYVDTSAHWTPGTGNANPPAYSFNFPSKQDGFNVDVVNVVIEKPLDEGTWSAGYKVDLLFGPNAVGFNNSINGDNTSDVGIKQAYVALRVPYRNGIDVKIGTFDTIIGYEVFNAGSNPNYTRSWGYTIEPTENTGILATYQFNKNIGATVGIANTHAAGINGRSGRVDKDAEASKAYMASVTLTAPDSWGALAGSGLYFGVVDGWNTANDVTSYYIGATINTPVKALKIGAAWDYAVLHNNSFGPSGRATSLALYASLAPENTKFSFHLRGEWADITDANATGGRNNGFGGGGVGGVPAEVLSLTGTIQYDLWANVLSRLEIRWDHALAGHGPFGGSVAGASGPLNPNGSGGANEKNSVLVAANIIYKF